VNWQLNRFFDFSSNQIKFLALLSATIILMGLYLLIQAYASPQQDSPPFKVYVGDSEQQFEGIFILDPNTAPADSLELLPGIGKGLADRIVEYRMTHHFDKEIDITNVRGIGAKTFEKLRPYLKVKK